MANGSKIVSAVRTVISATVEKQDHTLVFRVSADGFLYHMVRIMMGTIIEVGRGYMTPSDVKEALLAKDRSRMGPTAPPQGLYLNRVEYDMTGTIKPILPPRE
jgi:tRNA pseudouridine38-40 synthase